MNILKKYLIGQNQTEIAEIPEAETDLEIKLYGADCWRMTEKDINKLSSFNNGWLRIILKIFWPVEISNENLHEITNFTNYMVQFLRSTAGDGLDMC